MFNKESYMWKLDVSKNLLQKKRMIKIATVKFRWQVKENGGSTKISSMNTTTNLSNSGMKTEFMRYMKNAGALVRPKDMTRYSYSSYLVEKVVFGISYGWILIWGYLKRRSIFENTLAPANWSNKVSIQGKGYLLLMVTALRGW